MFNVDNRTEAQIEGDTSAFVSDLKLAIPGVKFVYARLIPPANITYNGQSYVTATANGGGWAKYDAFLQQLMPNMLTIDYGLIQQAYAAMGLRQSIDGIHWPHGATKLAAVMAYDGMPALFGDLQTSLYPPFEDGTMMLNAVVNSNDPNHALALGVMSNLGLIP